MTKLTPNFSLAELTFSATAEDRGIVNNPTTAHLANLTLLAVGLEQVRSFCFDNPVRIHSGYRSEAVNRIVKGTLTSDHVKGFAADITVDTYTPLELAKALDMSPLVFDQLIYEPSRGIVHISFNPRLRRQVLTQRGGPGSPIEQGIQE